MNQHNLEPTMVNYETTIQQLYVAYFNRPADPGGLAHWQRVIESQGGSLDIVTAAFASSDEYKKAYAGKTNVDIVNTVYRNLFGRDGEDDGVKFWAGKLTEGSVIIDDAVTAIAAGAQGADLVAFDNKVKYATSFTKALDVHPEQAAYNGDEALAYAKALTTAVTTNDTLATATANLEAATAGFVAASRAPIVFTLSANADAGVAFKGGGGNDTFNATAASFSAGDSIHGGGGRNTLSIDDDGSAMAGAVPGQVSVTNIQQVNIATKGGVGNAGAYDMSGFAGLEQVNIAAGGAVNVKVVDTVAIDIKTNAGAVTTQGGRAVAVDGNTGVATLNGNALISVSLANTNQHAVINNATADHELNLRVSEVGNRATITDANAKTVNLQVGAVQGGVGSNINLAAAKATALNIDNAANFELVTTALAADDKLASLSLKGAGAFKTDATGIASLKTFDASQSSGANTVSLATTAGLTVKGGSGMDLVSMLGALAGNATVNLGAGNDRYDFTQAALAGAKVDGGAGIDTVVMNDSALIGAGSPVYSNFEVLDFSSGKGVYDLDKVGSVTTLHTHARLRGPVEFTNGRADSRIEMVSQDVNHDLTGAPADNFVIGANIKFILKDASGSNDKLTISMSANDANADNRANGLVKANNFETSGIETITLHSTVNKTEHDSPATGSNEAKAPSDYLNSFGFLDAQGSKTVLVTGDASLDMVSIYSDTLEIFDASASSGDVNFDGVVRSAAAAGKGLNYLGSQGTDYYTATAAGGVFQGNGGEKDYVILNRDKVVKDTIVFTKASDSQLVWASQGSKQVNDYDVINNFQVGTDKIDLSALHLAAGANRDGFAKFKVASNTDHILQSTIKDGADVFNDNGVDRSIAFAMYGEDDGWMLVDVNGDGNYTSGTDMAFAMYGNTSMPGVADFIF
ncbi:DUF4214 domain-containing protein [Massilia agri]|uniref:DUF4214 domain-containing protein n=1 Tax=Massilia agri TaxID=1886785 RepID=A0ABT2AIB7_9BURK|nr:DUF4214 domain-containing protein [Massilia agri]MCS0595976.1 DUF4214 domain-containing protein [Massilia agri]